MLPGPGRRWPSPLASASHLLPLPEGRGETRHGVGRASSCFALAATHASISVCGHHLDPRAHPPLQSLPYLSASPSLMDSSEAVAAVSRNRSIRLPLTFLTGSLAPPRREAPHRQPPRRATAASPSPPSPFSGRRSSPPRFAGQRLSPTSPSPQMGSPCFPPVSLTRVFPLCPCP